MWTPLASGGGGDGDGDGDGDGGGGSAVPGLAGRSIDAVVELGAVGLATRRVPADGRVNVRTIHIFHSTS